MVGWRRAANCGGCLRFGRAAFDQGTGAAYWRVKRCTPSGHGGGVMGYALDLARVPQEADPVGFFESQQEASEARSFFNPSDLNPGAPDPQKEARKQALAAALRRVDPALEPF